MSHFLRSIEVKADDGSIDYDLSLLHPTPEALADTVSGWFGVGTPEQDALEKKQQENIAMYGHKDWYDWNIANWSTKWSPSDIERMDAEDDDTEAEFIYQTAWCPASNLIKFISGLYPNLSFYESGREDGVGFVCHTFFKGGELVEECGFEFGDLEQMPMFEEKLEEAYQLADQDAEDEIREDMDDYIMFVSDQLLKSLISDN
jgi:hypothetical protein